jgi:hypothetical protein
MVLVAVSPDNHRVVSGSEDSTIRIWNASTGENEHVLRGHSEMVLLVAVSPDNHRVVSWSEDSTIRIWNTLTGEEEPPFVISFAISSGNFYLVSGPQVKTMQVGSVFLSSMVTSIALSAQGDNTRSIPVLQQLVSSESLPLDIFLQASRKELLPLPTTLTSDYSPVLLSNGKKCLAIPSALQDFSCVAFSGSKVCLGYFSGQINILDISTWSYTVQRLTPLTKEFRLEFTMYERFVRAISDSRIWKSDQHWKNFHVWSWS